MTQSSTGTSGSFGPLVTVGSPVRPSSGANKSFDEGGQFVWDSTSLSLAQTCPRKYQLKMIDGWQQRRKSVHLLFGGFYATALEHYYKHRAMGDTLDEALEKVIFETLVATWEYEEEEITEDKIIDDAIVYGVSTTHIHKDGRIFRIRGGKPWDSGHTAKTRETLIRTIIWYVDNFAQTPTKVIVIDGVPAVEKSFTVEVDNQLWFAGHLDSLVEYAADPYVMDQKTTGSTISPLYFKGYNPDIQMSMYTFGGKAIFHIPVRGVIIDAAQIAVGFTRFERGFTMRTAAQLDEWYEEMMLLIEQIRHYTTANYFPMNRTACGNYGGCEFRDVCSRDPGVRPNMLAADFIQGPSWDPLDRR